MFDIFSAVVRVVWVTREEVVDAHWYLHLRGFFCKGVGPRWAECIKISAPETVGISY